MKDLERIGGIVGIHSRPRGSLLVSGFEVAAQLRKVWTGKMETRVKN